MLHVGLRKQTRGDVMNPVTSLSAGRGAGTHFSHEMAPFGVSGAAIKSRLISLNEIKRDFLNPFLRCENTDTTATGDKLDIY